jgi:cytidyltransferase-like protein
MNQPPTIGYTQGVFDLLHFGHIKFLQFASTQCTELIVGVISDKLASTYKQKPVINETERLQLINQLRFVKTSLIIEDKDPYYLASNLKFDIFFWGKEWQTAANIEMERKLAGIDVKVIWVPRYGELSSTKLRKIIEN